MNVVPIKTRIFKSHENLADFIVQQVPMSLVKEKMVLAVTSKIVSLAEGQIAKRAEFEKADLVKREADVFLGEVGYGVFLTIKEGLLIPSAGIDESNAESGDFILYPPKPYESAKNLWTTLRQRWGLKDLGILLTDSHTSPLRKGVTGICLSYWGFESVKDMVGSQDLFGRTLKMTKMNFADGLSAAAVMMMGEGNEAQPLAVIHGVPLSFCEQASAEDLLMPLKEDLYFPILEPLIKKEIR